jgi:hypothetical protein
MHPDLLHSLARAQHGKHLDDAADRRLAATARAHGQRRARLVERGRSLFVRRKPVLRRRVPAFPAPRYAARPVSRN